MTMIYALVDCNNFYVSCERTFNGALHNRPVLVLSNNDGCVVARSNDYVEYPNPLPYSTVSDALVREGSGFPCPG